MNNLFCKFCNKEFLINNAINDYYGHNFYCCNAEYTILKSKEGYKISCILFGNIYINNVVYFAIYDYKENTTTFKENNFYGKAPSYCFDGFVDESKLIRLLKLKPFW